MLSLNSKWSLVFYRTARKDAYALVLIRLHLKVHTAKHHRNKRGEILRVITLLHHSHNLPPFRISPAGHFSFQDCAAFLS